MYMVLGDKNYVGPVPEVLNFASRRKKQVLDVGTGEGSWYVRPLVHNDVFSGVIDDNELKPYCVALS